MSVITGHGYTMLHSLSKNKEEFRSRPINAFVDIFALSQSECVVGYYLNSIIIGIRTFALFIRRSSNAHSIKTRQ